MEIKITTHRLENQPTSKISRAFTLCVYWVPFREIHTYLAKYFAALLR